MHLIKHKLRALKTLILFSFDNPVGELAFATSTNPVAELAFAHSSTSSARLIRRTDSTPNRHLDVIQPDLDKWFCENFVVS